MNPNDKKLKELMDSAVAKGATHLVASPKTIKKLQEKGLPIKERFITYEEYSDELYSKRKKDAVALLTKLPKIDDSIANGVISEIYEEIRSSYAFGVFTSTIFNSILILEYSMRLRLQEERLKDDPNAKWEELEKLDMDALIQQLFKHKIITKKEKFYLVNFSATLRNPYLHINILKLTEGIYINKLPKVDIEKGEVEEMRDVEAGKHPYLWFAAKKFFDRTQVQPVIDFCIKWTNQLLKK